MLKALLDTNMLLAIAQFKADVIGELRKHGYVPIILSCVKQELEKLALGRSKDAKAARVALELLEKHDFDYITKGGPVDSALLSVAKSEGWAVATNDAALIKKLKAQGIMAIRLRQKKMLVLE